MVIQKIRQRTGLLIGIMAVAMILFLMMDGINSGRLFGGGQVEYLGSVNGKEISQAEFETKFEESWTNYLNNRASQEAPTSTEEFFVRNNTWDSWVKNTVMNNVYENLGLAVTTKEMGAMTFGSEITHPQVEQTFKNPQTGQFDGQQALVYIQNLDNDQTGDSRRRWESFEKFMKEDRYNKKMEALVKNSFYTPSWKGDVAAKQLGSSVDISYVKVPYSSIDDASVEVSNGDITNYINENAGEFMKDEPSRKIRYVSFLIEPSADDHETIRNEVAKLKDEFAASENDSLFVNARSTTKFDGIYQKEERVSDKIAEVMFNDEPGAMVGPYLESGKYTIAKLVDRKMISDSVDCRHILFGNEGLTSQAEAEAKRALADSIFDVIKNQGGDFDALARQYSDGPTKVKGGDLGTVKPGQMVKPFNDAIFYQMDQGDVQMVSSQFGLHIVQVTKARPTTPAVKIAYLTRQLLPSRATDKNIYKKASEFSAKHNNKEKFLAAAEENPALAMRTIESVDKNSNSIGSIQNARNIVRWVYENEAGAVSQPLKAGSQQLVIMIEEVNDKGLPTAASVRNRVEAQVRNAKKYDKLAAELKGKTDLASVASAKGVAQKTASGLSFTKVIVGDDGFEPEVVASALALNEGETFGPIEGRNGAYFVQVTKKTAPTGDNTAYLNQAKRDNSNVATFKMFDAFKEYAKIEDNRFVFF